MPPSSRGWLRLFRNPIPIPASHLLPPKRSFAISPARHSKAPIVLRNYQEECIQAVLAGQGEGQKRMGISLATGAGKTVIFTNLIGRVPPRQNNANQTLILAHRQELVEQAARHCQNAYPTQRVEIEMGSLHASGNADITVASIQSIISGDRISKFDSKRFKLVLVDEAHHIVAPGYLKALSHFGLNQRNGDSPTLVGVSATLSRLDGLRLGTAIDTIVYHKDYIDMIGEGFLSDVIFTTVQTKADISRVRRGVNGDFAASELSRAVNTDAVNDITFRSWYTKASHRKSTLVFCVDLAHVAGLTATFRKNGIDARFVTGATAKAERSARLDSFRNGDFPVLVNCGVYTEGTDVPNIDCVLLARPTKSRNLLVQMIGRGMRLHPGKENCHIIDMVASLETGIVTTPTLFGLDPSEVVNEVTHEDMQTMLKAKEAEAERVKTLSLNGETKPSKGISDVVTFTDYDSVFDLIQDTSREKHIRSISPHAWVNVGSDKYILTNTDGSYVRIERLEDESDKGEWMVSEVVALSRVMSKAPFARPRLIARAVTFPDAVHGADTFASEKYPWIFIARTSARRKRPATEGQVNFLNKLRSKDEQLGPDSLNRGQAGDMITKLKHGARGHFSSLEADKRRLGRAKLKVELEQALRDREKVMVGPL
ncbi:p-loop containing nucleoside triphosphate hydrolase-25 [Coleophoma cylindrospora]|uniref:p-loop containing nucleoside triphosphate hydrolase-25 n=1 Tax=Coleophoma cylindrospora TaxID=1849047 RepID=A0A3D8S009_9HELO|nr:p-loop containing nucleoside triphosphate hydrolase-25 [Coleophoma cylindrospora]